MISSDMELWQLKVLMMSSDWKLWWRFLRGMHRGGGGGEA